MKEVRANTFVEVTCSCPHCDAFLDILDNDQVRESLGSDHRAEDCDIEITCSECNQEFIVTDIDF